MGLRRYNSPLEEKIIRNFAKEGEQRGLLNIMVRLGLPHSPSALCVLGHGGLSTKRD